MAAAEPLGWLAKQVEENNYAILWLCMARSGWVVVVAAQLAYTVTICWPCSAQQWLVVRWASFLTSSAGLGHEEGLGEVVSQVISTLGPFLVPIIHPGQATLGGMVAQW